MTRRTPGAGAAVALALGLALVLGACRVPPGGTPSPSVVPTPRATPTLTPTLNPAPTPSPSPATPSASAALESPVVGVILDLDIAGLADIRGFTFRTDAGQTVEFVLGELDNADVFPPSHLPEHMAAGDPLRVSFRMEDGRPVAYHIEHAH